ncbi:hypothetical protein JCM10207_001181 [Rhodosporidiobolus poonsookiae]
MASLFRAYNSALVRRPYIAGSATAAVLFGAGDVLAQQAIEKKGRQHDYMRTVRLSAYGGLIFAPIVTRFYGVLEGIKLQSAVTTTAARVALDQFALTPCMVSLFFTAQTFLEGKGVDEAKKRLEKSWWPTLQRNWGVWIPVQLANFSLVPPHMRLVVVNVVSLFWNAYLSYANSLSGPPKDTDLKEAIGTAA